MNEKRPDERKRTRVEGEVAPGRARRVSRGPLLTAPAEVRAVLAAIVESSDDAIVGKTLDGTIMTWSPAIALTAYATTGDRVRIFTAGFQVHVVKPIEPTELVTVVASAARRLPSLRTR